MKALTPEEVLTLKWLLGEGDDVPDDSPEADRRLAVCESLVASGRVVETIESGDPCPCCGQVDEVAVYDVTPAGMMALRIAVDIARRMS